MLRDEYFRLYARVLSEQLAHDGVLKYALERTDSVMEYAEEAATEYAERNRAERDRIADEIERIREG